MQRSTAAPESGAANQIMSGRYLEWAMLCAAVSYNIKGAVENSVGEGRHVWIRYAVRAGITLLNCSLLCRYKDSLAIMTMPRTVDGVISFLPSVLWRR